MCLYLYNLYKYYYQICKRQTTTMDPQPSQQPKTPNNETFASSSAEQQQVGISCYISKGKPIPAVTKYLLTDFVVNQISQDGTVVKIMKKPDLTLCNKNKNNNNHVQQYKYQMNKQLYEEISQILGKQTATALQQLYKRMQQGQKVAQWQYTIEEITAITKQQRTKLHTFVRNKLTNIQSNTLDGNKMKLKLNKKIRKNNPASKNKYTYFVLYKSNIDTMGAIFKLSKLTGINQKLFSSAGLKDKRGVTTQMISVYNTQLSQLQKFYSMASRNKQIWIQGFKQNMDSDIGVGQLYGNQFGLIIRFIQAQQVDIQLIAERVQSLKNNGIINYFGMQRFGSCGTKTYMIGFKILKKMWKQIVQDLVLQDAKDYKINQLKEQCYAKQNYARAERQLPNKYKIQKNIFKGLKRHGKNYQNVFQSLPRSMKTLYLHSLQSYLWNRIASKRITQHGFSLKIGDLVGKKLTGFKLAQAEIENDQKDNMQKDKQQVQKQLQQQQILQQVEEQDKYQVYLLQNQQQLSNYKITDVVLPLYGPSIDLPHNSLAYKYLSEQLKQLNLTHQQFTQNGKKLCFNGMYRKMIIKPENVSYSIISHRSIKQQLQTPLYVNGQKLNIQQGNKKAAHIVFQLPKSSYATMALRQILHIPSSFETQMALNKLYEKEQNKKQQPIPQTIKQSVDCQKIE